MFASASPSEPGRPRGPDIPAFVRAKSEVRARFARIGAATKLADLYETGGQRLKVPNSASGCEAVLINTAGGMTGGDEARLSLTAGHATRCLVTTQSAEKIYRAEQAPATVTAELIAEQGSRLIWAPQETILFDGSRLKRTLTVHMASDAAVLVFEMTVFGRVARDERINSGLFTDRWRIWRDDDLVFADDVRLDGDISALMKSPATGGGAYAIGTLLYVAQDAEKRLNAVRAELPRARSSCGASAWNGMLVARFLARDPFDLRHDAARALRRVSKTELPRIWLV